MSLKSKLNGLVGGKMIQVREAFQERRAYQRLPVRMPVRYQLKGEKNIKRASTIDISPGGLGIFTDSKVYPENDLIIWIKFFDGNKPLYLSGKIVWSIERMPRLWRVGIKFNKPNFEYLKRLSYGYRYL